MGSRFSVHLGPLYEAEATAGLAAVGSGDFQLADWLDPTFMSDCCNGEIGEVRAIANKLPEDAWHLVYYDQVLKIFDNGWVTGSSSPSSGGGSPIFAGVIVKKNVLISGKETKFEVVAYSNADWFLHRKKLHGQKRRSHSLEQSWFNAGDADGAQSLTLSDDVITIDTPLVFNPQGQPNATKQTYFIAGDDSGGDASANTFHLFEAPFRNQYNTNGDHLTAVPWRLSWAVKYILSFYKADWAIDRTGWADTALEAVFGNDDQSSGAGSSSGSGSGNPVISEVNLEGRSLAEALALLLTPYNYGFNVSPDPTGTGGKQQIKFFYRGSGTTVTVKLAERGTDAGESDANLVTCELLFDSTPVINEIEGYGAQIVHCTLAHTDPPTPGMDQNPVAKLVKGWKTSDLVWAYTSGSSTILNTFDKTFRKHYCQPDLISGANGGSSSGGGGGSSGTTHYPWGVGRLWIVNQGQVPAENLEDLSTDLWADSDGSNSVDLRRLEKPEVFNQNSAGGQLQQTDIVVEMSLDSGMTWGIVDKSWYRVLSEGMGIVFIRQNLEKLGIQIPHHTLKCGTSYWQALHDGTLQLRILCSIKSDERVAARVDNDGSVCHLAHEREIENVGYRETVYNPLINDAVYYSDYTPLKVEVDDTKQLSDLCKQTAKLTNRLMISGKCVVLLEDFGEYRPGMVVTSIENRDGIDLTPSPTVMRVVYQFREQLTEVILDNRNVKSIVRARPVTGDTQREHQLGVEHVSPIVGGHRGPLPGDMKSLREFMWAGGGGE